MFDKNNGNNVSDNVKEGEFNSIMPWQKYAGMTREDLSAIFAYLKTVKPISNKVPKNTYLK